LYHAADTGLCGAWSDAKRLLDLFVLEKAFYELRYELAHRPDWVPLPLHGILEAIGVASDASRAPDGDRGE